MYSFTTYVNSHSIARLFCFCKQLSNPICVNFVIFTVQFSHWQQFFFYDYIVYKHFGNLTVFNLYCFQIRYVWKLNVPKNLIKPFKVINSSLDGLPDITHSLRFS